MRNTLSILFVLAGCGPTSLVVREPSEVIVTARVPADPEIEARVVVKRDRLVVRDELQFDSDRATILAESDSVLDEIARVINAHPELVKVRIEGHTDAVGNERANQELSERRAIAVRSYLIEHGVDARRLIAEGFGADNPIAPNDTEDGRAKNRRVAFTVLDRVDGDSEEEITTTPIHKHDKHGGGNS